MTENFGTLSALPPDPLLGLMGEYRQDQRSGKVDLGVGVYKDEAGNTPIMQAVHAAEEVLAKTAVTKVYEGPRGNIDFCDALARLALGDDKFNEIGSRLVSYATPGGTGALSLAMALITAGKPDAKIWISDPSWPNHKHIAGTIGAAVAKYTYHASEPGRANFEKMSEVLAGAAPGDGIVIQGPCHNPTGVDLRLADWTALGRLCAERDLIPIIDIAYHGLGASLGEDRAGITAFLQETQIAMIAYSCSKNFALYRERTGCLLVNTQSEAMANVLSTHLANISRAYYSMPPAHGAAIVSEILNDKDLRLSWENELTDMRGRIKTIRDGLAAALVETTGDANLDRLKSERGMFSILPLKPGASTSLSRDHAIYLPASGRINIAGISNSNIDYLAEKLAPFLEKN